MTGVQTCALPISYEAHVAQKKAATRQKEMMRSMHLDVSPGSEGVITPEEDWKAAHGGYWRESDIPMAPHNEDQDASHHEDQDEE